MRKLLLSALALMSLATVITFTSCDKDETFEYTPEALGKATIKGKVSAELDVTNNVYETAPAGTRVSVTLDTELLAANPINGYDYEVKTYEATTDANGEYTITVDASSKAASVTIYVEDFTSNDMVYTTAPVAFNIVENITKVQDFVCVNTKRDGEVKKGIITGWAYLNSTEEDELDTTGTSIGACAGFTYEYEYAPVGTVVIAEDANNDVFETAVKADGLYEFNLAPGTYTVKLVDAIFEKEFVVNDCAATNPDPNTLSKEDRVFTDDSGLAAITVVAGQTNFSTNLKFDVDGTEVNPKP